MTPDELERLAGERRHDDQGRDRIAAIARRFAQIARELDKRERRVEQAVRILQVVAVLLIVFGAIGGILLAKQANKTDRVAAQQTTARYQAVYTSCLERNKTNDGIIDYLRKLGADEKEVSRAREFFPSEPKCRLYTTALLGDPAPRDAFEIPEVLRERTQRPR